MSLYVNIEKRLGDFILHACFETANGITGLLGASGCGKSLTLRCIAGIENPDHGRIVLDGETLFDSEQHINLPPQRRHIGFLFQNYALFPNMTVRQNILCGLHAQKDRKLREAACTQIIQMLQLQGLENHHPHQLSGGQAQRTALARILVSQPRLLMLDEPFSALDSHLRFHLQMQMLSLLQSYNHDVMLVTHDRDEVYRLCDSIAVMHAGYISSPRPTKALFDDPQTIHAARLTCCDNIFSARKAGPHALFVPDLNITFTCASAVQDNVCAVGIHAHNFAPKLAVNRFPVACINTMENPSEQAVRFRYTQQTASSDPVWWHLSKELWANGMPPALGVAPQDVMPLYPSESFDKNIEQP